MCLQHNLQTESVDSSLSVVKNNFVSYLCLEICALLGYYAALCGNCLPMFQDNIPEECRSHQHCGGSLKSISLSYLSGQLTENFLIGHLPDIGRMYISVIIYSQITVKSLELYFV